MLTAETGKAKENAKRQNISKMTVSGYVRDGETGESLIGAGILAGERSGAVTNDFGFYSITVPLEQRSLTYSCVGYENVAVSLDSQRDTVINIGMEKSGFLKAATVTAYRESGIYSTLSGSLEVPKTLIENVPAVLGEADALKALQMLPGVQGGLEGFSGIYVRGGNSDENLILMDGIPLYNVNHLFGLLSAFTPEAVKKVTLYKGSFPARYGGRVSSIIDVRTNDGNAKELHGSVSAGLLAEKLHLEGPIGDSLTTFSVSMRGMHTLLLDRVIEWAGSPLNYAFYDINAKLTRQFGSKDKIYLGFYTGSDYFRIKYDAHEVKNRVESRESLDYHTNWGNLAGSLRWNHVFSGKLFSNTRLSFNRYRMNSSYDGRNENYASEGLNIEEGAYSNSSMIRDLSLACDFEWSPSPSHRISFGGEYVKHLYRPSVDKIRTMNQTGDLVIIDTTYTQLSSRKLSGGEASLYLEDNMQLSRRLSVCAGVHLSLFHADGRTYFTPEPRISARYSLSDGLAVKASYSRMSQYVHLLTLGEMSLPTDLWVPITADIEPVISDIASIGLAYTGLRGWEFSAEGYLKRADNVIDYMDGKIAMASYSNWEDNVAMGESRSRGIELYAAKNAGKLTGVMSYTLSKSERRYPGGEINNGEWFPFTYDRRHDFRIFASYKANERISVNGSWSIVSGNMMTIPEREGTAIGPDGSAHYIHHISSRNNYRVEPSHHLDLGVSFSKKKKHGERIWNFGIYNVYCALNPNWMVIVENHDEGSDLRPYLSKRSFLTFLPSFSYTYRF